MNTPKTVRTIQHARNGGCCEDSECGPGVRNKYFIGKRLTPDSFSVEQQYSLDRRHLLNRAIHGWGVVYGYGVERSPSGEKLEITAGLALDECGRELLHSATSLKINDDLLILDDGYKNIKPEDRDKTFDEAGEDARWMLSVHYAERSVGAVNVDDSCYCDHQKWDRTCETVRFSLRKVSREECCNGFDCDWKCKCSGCCDETDEKDERVDQYLLPDRAQNEPISVSEEWDPNPQREREKVNRSKEERGRSHKRGGCRCLCEHITGFDFSDKCGGRLCAIKEACGTVEVDLRNGVPLACVSVVWGECGWSFGEEIEDCGPRRLVKRNDLLFDLIRGCDLTHISRIGWWRAHRMSVPITFDAFVDAFGTNFDSEGNCITQRFWVEFSQLVRWDTVRRDCFVMTIVTDERDDGWWETLRVPIVRIEKEDAELIDMATIVVDGGWLREIVASGDPVKSSYSLFQGKTTRVELEIRGDFIVDCNGQTLDANAQGLSPGPTGNGTPGGSFLSTFLVGPAPSRSRPVSSYTEDRIKGVS